MTLPEYEVRPNENKLRRGVVDHAKTKGVDATWLPVVGGAHTDAWAQPEVIEQVFDFFDAHRKKG